MPSTKLCGAQKKAGKCLPCLQTNWVTGGLVQAGCSPPAAEQWCADPADGPGPVVQPPPAACTLDADAQAKAGLYAGMRVELCKIV